MSSQLFTLVHSLDKSEKRFFSIYAKMGAGRAFDSTLQLFDVICGMAAWDEDTLAKALKTPALRDNLSSIKTRLLDLILDSQRLLRSKKTIGSQLRASIDDIEFLLSKQHYAFAKKRLRKAQAIALHFEEEAMMLQLLYWEAQLFVRMPDAPEVAFYARMEAANAHHLARLDLQQGFLRLHDQIRSLVRTVVRARKPEDVEAYRAIVQHPLMRTPPPEDAFYTTSLFLQIRGTYHLALGETEAAWDNFDLLMQRWESHADQIEHRSDLYLSSLNNYLGTCITLPKYHRQFVEHVSRAKQIQRILPTTRFKLEWVIYLQELLYHMNFKPLEEAQPFLQEFEDWLNRNENTLDPARRLPCFHNLTQYHFMYGQFKGANRWLQKILQFPATDARQDIQDYAQVFQLVLHYALGNLDLQEYLLRNARRHLKQEGKVFEMEDALLSWAKGVQKIGQAGSKREIALFQVLLERLLPLADGSTGRPPLGLIELVLWAESKVAGVAIAEYTMRKMFPVEE